VAAPVLPTAIDAHDSEFLARRAGMVGLLGQIEQLLRQASAGGGLKATERHRSRGKLPIRGGGVGRPSGGQIVVQVCRHGHRVWVQGPDGYVEITAIPRFPEPESETVPGALVAPMPGKVVAIEVNPGDIVKGGQVLLVVEAMKMEHRVAAPHCGVDVEVRARPGQQVRGGDLLVVLDS